MGTLDLGVANRTMQLQKKTLDATLVQNELLREQNELLAIQLEQAQYQSRVLYAILGTLSSNQTAPPTVPAPRGG